MEYQLFLFHPTSFFHITQKKKQWSKNYLINSPFGSWTIILIGIYFINNSRLDYFLTWSAWLPWSIITPIYRVVCHPLYKTLNNHNQGPFFSTKKKNGCVKILAFDRPTPRTVPYVAPPWALTSPPCDCRWGKDHSFCRISTQGEQV